MRFIYLSLIFSSLQAALFVEDPRGCNDSLREFLLKSMSPYAKIVEEEYEKKEAILEQFAKPFNRERSLYLQSNVAEVLKNRGDFQRLRNDITRGSWVESKQFRSGAKLELEASFSDYKSPKFGFRGEELKIRLSQPLLKGFRFGSLAVQEKISKQQLKIDTLDRIHELSQTLVEPVTLYWNLIYAKERVFLRQKVLREYERLFSEARSKKMICPLIEVSKIVEERSLAKRALTLSLKDLECARRPVEALFQHSICLDRLDSFPIRGSTLDSKSYCIDRAFVKRKDLRALYLLEEGISWLISQGKNEKLPAVDVTLDYKIDDLREKGEPKISLFCSIPTYKENRGIVPQMTAKNEVLFEISSRKGEVAREVGEIYDALKGLERGQASRKVLSLNQRADFEEKELKRDRDYAILLTRLHLAMGTLLEVDEEFKSLSVCKEY